MRTLIKAFKEGLQRGGGKEIYELRGKGKALLLVCVLQERPAREGGGGRVIGKRPKNVEVTGGIFKEIINYNVRSGTRIGVDRGGRPAREQKRDISPRSMSMGT